MAIRRVPAANGQTDPSPLFPSNADAERGVLGSILIDPAAMDEVVAILSGPVDFYYNEHRDTYEAMLALYQRQRPTDLINVMDKLQECAKLEQIGGVSALSALANNVPSSALAASYATIVHQHAERRRTMSLLDSLNEAAEHADFDSFAAYRRSVADAFTDDNDTAASQLPILTDEEAEALPPLKGILGDILFDASVSYLYGPSGRWKSFVALSWAMAVATGQQWLGRSVVEGDVLYVCSEGARGMGKRVTAWKLRHGVTGRTRLRILPLAIDLTNVSQVQALLLRIKALDLHPILIIFDTLAASSSGDENASETASGVDRAARRISRALDSEPCVLIVHHTGYDATHMRGSTAFAANADTVIRIEGGDANRRIEPGEPITLISDKAKDGEPFRDLYLTTEAQTWADDDGRIHSALVVVPCDADLTRKAKAKDGGMTPKRAEALTVLEAAGENGLSASAWQRASDMGHSTFYNVLSYLLTNKLVDITPGGNYIRSLASPVSPVQSNLGPIGLAKNSPVQSSLS